MICSTIVIAIVPSLNTLRRILQRCFAALVTLSLFSLLDLFSSRLSSFSSFSNFLLSFLFSTFLLYRSLQQKWRKPPPSNPADVPAERLGGQLDGRWAALHARLVRRAAASPPSLGAQQTRGVMTAFTPS